MGKIISIVNQKGGVGKTTTAINLSASLAVLDYKILLIDTDPQANAGSGIGVDSKEQKHNIYTALVGQSPIKDCIVKTQIPNLDLISSHIDLAGFELEIVNQVAREYILKEIIGEVKDDYDFIFIDCSPSLGLMVINSIVASDSVLIPVQCEYFALEGIAKLQNTIEIIRKRLNPELAMEGYVLTMYDGRTNLSKMVVDDVRKHFGTLCFSTLVPRNVKLAEAPSYGVPALLMFSEDGEFDISYLENKGAKSYIDLAKELLRRNSLPEIKNGE
ncbi:ParA family protein [Leadbetterella byssophila]|uniref:Chromosome segregation ATPase n=1 Tax=Leadbetterella byssophila (strain DSM 17132 / JCM 16389 / KACC 11308 / NBRC 106382 / 4M15) TaxID=649349 RepID=E4RTP4_LEAB4|nr:AAA family ATPase [Leadbetterella byssophila]ADQ17768.1 chromosome segregation ATPase [Leadbetterella byssophila DSM 17132]